MKRIIPIIFISTAIFLLGFGIYAIASKNKKDVYVPTANINISPTAASSELVIKADDQIRGKKDASITLYEYSDFQCPYCVRFHPVMTRLVETYPTQVRWVYRNYPLPFHVAAKGAAIAAEAAGRQGKFWEFADKLAENSQSDGTGIQSKDLVKYANDLGLNFDKFNSDLANPEITQKIDADIASGNAMAIQGTPSIFLVDQNGKAKAIEPTSFESVKAEIDALLK